MPGVVNSNEVLASKTCLRLNHIERLDVHRFWNMKGKD